MRKHVPPKSSQWGVCSVLQNEMSIEERARLAEKRKQIVAHAGFRRI